MLTPIISKFMRNKLAVAGGLILCLVSLAVLLAPLLAPYDPDYQLLSERLEPPSAMHWLGTDYLGRDIWSRLLYGGRVSLLVGVLSMMGAITIGTCVGALAGYYGGKVDALLMRFVDVLIAFPSIFLYITIVAIFQPSLDKLIAIFALLGWTGAARLVRAEVLTLREREFVLAARTIGMGHLRIILTQILPNAMAPIIVAATLSVGSIILAESALSFLGLGVQPPISTWGNMLNDAQGVTVFLEAWWYPIFPGAMIFLTVLCINFVGDGLRDALDPHRIEQR